MSLHIHGVILEAIDSTNKGDWFTHEEIDLLDTYEGVWLSMDCFDFFGHYVLCFRMFSFKLLFIHTLSLSLRT